MYGFAGAVLRVDLNTRRVTRETLDPRVARQFLGGRGFGARVIFDEVAAGADPFGPANRIVFAVGPFTGTSIPGSSRLSIVSKSPLTGLIGDSDLGGPFPRELKAAGLDAVIVQGRAESPVYLYVDGDKASLGDASWFWGATTGEADSRLSEELGEGVRSICIGPAGENLVRYACIASQGRHFAGRAGLGAVMGCKNLKAVAVRGALRPEVACPGGLRDLVRRINREITGDGTCASLSEYGTWNSTAPTNAVGVLPTLNFRYGSFDRIERIDGGAMLASIFRGRRTCPGCPVFCRRTVEAAGKYRASPEWGGPQYEAVAALGPTVGVDSPEAIAAANEACNMLGLDVISTGVSIAFAIESAERGVLPRRQDGLELRWGDADALMSLIAMIGRREGLGRLLGEGVRRASTEVGGGSQGWAMHVKGQEVPMHDPRGKKGMGLNYAASAKGPDHMECMHDEAFQRENALADLGLVEPLSRTSLEAKPQLVRLTQDYWGVLPDCLTVCKFPLAVSRPFKPRRIVECLRYVTGWDVALDECLEIGERVFNLGRMFAVREGLTREDDVLPSRFSEPLASGGSAGQSIGREEMESALDEYYAVRGWDRAGRPTWETVERLGLAGIAERGGYQRGGVSLE